ncbi:hypothetical protein, partial [Salmonella sp. gx-f7]|uniref:hypothetical protein n=1 Tax=Salmonella sp. gx-f7 TaxID=2582606 RepID=UPI001F35B010
DTGPGEPVMLASLLYHLYTVILINILNLLNELLLSLFGNCVLHNVQICQYTAAHLANKLYQY